MPDRSLREGTNRDGMDIPVRDDDPERLRADVIRLAENHDQVVRWLREKEAECESLRRQLGGSVSSETRERAIEALAKVRNDSGDCACDGCLVDAVLSVVVGAPDRSRGAV